MDNLLNVSIGSAAAYFGIDCREGISVLPGGTANRSFVVKGRQKKYVIRERSSKYSKPEWIAYEGELLHHLSGAGLPVPVPINGPDGNEWTCINDRVYQAYDFIEGESYRGDTGELAEAGGFLARYHNAVGSFNASAAKDLPRYDDPAAMETFINGAVELFHNCAEGMEKTAYLASQIKQIGKVIPESLYRKLPSLAVHGDYHPANVLYRNGKISGLFDFDWVSTQPRIRDVIDGIVYFSARRSREFDGTDIYSLIQSFELDMERCGVFLKSYGKECIRPLESIELLLIPFFIKARWINSRIQATSKVSRQKLFDVLLKDVEGPLEWLDANHGRLLSVCISAVLG